MTHADPARDVEAVRDFTRYYTRRLGVLKEGLLDTDLPLPQARLVWELAHREAATAAALARDLALDPAYVSRLLKSLERRGLVAKRRSQSDGRARIVALTPAGRDVFAELDARSAREVNDMLAPLAPSERRGLTAAMSRVRRLLGPEADAPAPYVIRSHRPGDVGWAISRHGEIYADEFGWDGTFEALVAEIGAAFIRDFKPSREHCWIAERDGERVGSVFVVEKDRATAQLRLLLVDPSARGLRLGERLVDEVIRFARAKGYTKLTLWTNDCLHAARRIYQKAGFVLVDEAPHHSFGVDLVGQNWDLEL
ncbi:bifunctional helix-turn-helix transcriptional regulator/GNAT family N-acetyltransferase [Minwuia thermotolerans]|uniref:MarR family transcriptional regulator n=1 Tax=Minwuia thermotolerans TaxID=2056226 RepID=A0A2M9G4M0_9PROT|nr:helix-turn-helix domain-containing GNAT family N-acetyltransferase [Minwuia thermotolerans]PJK30662.1 MarR family transcriptional regulator [Minwuia thermotolerans]